MRPLTANENFRLLSWARVRDFAVPPSMIESATARRAVGDWAGACAAARVDVDLDLRAVGRAHGNWLTAQVRADLRHLAPDLLRWHFPRTGPDGLLRPGLTVSLARYCSTAGSGGEIHLVARTPPAWAEAGQRISLALWGPSRHGGGVGHHPHPRPDRRYRLDLHRHLWDVRRTGELRERSGHWPSDSDLAGDRIPAWVGACAVDRWVAEAALLLRAEGRAGDVVAVRLTARHRLMLNPDAPGEPVAGCARVVPVLPDAATWVLPDLQLLHAGLIDFDRLHPLVASALRPDDRPVDAARSPDGSAGPRLVECRGATHRIAVVNGVLVPLDHDPDEIRREELLGALGGTGLPCLRAIDEAHRRPESLVDVRARLDHGDIAGAMATVESLLGPDVLLRSGALRDELEAAVCRRVAHGLYRAGLAGLGPAPSKRDTRRRVLRARPRDAALR
ncbi:hypothetical protein AMYBAR_005100 [Amycolatopsis bartoniae]|uniref:Uncharacterized protein n=1 Tax=Amycolatopsis bartoniae TaxID=941986 RepID=A0A8H9MF66_9PSEU|nr:hypothetical protein [Amycolatopsis bartoniae]TVT08843.1 hypothetical protein FNH07_10685 [Amycolatopsis bartoniae]GHF83855.1 hypothetical protein GCM10017566_67420 [Amycolatopsis bartoniae]